MKQGIIRKVSTPENALQKEALYRLVPILSQIYLEHGALRNDALPAIPDQALLKWSYTRLHHASFALLLLGNGTVDRAFAAVHLKMVS